MVIPVPPFNYTSLRIHDRGFQKGARRQRSPYHPSSHVTFQALTTLGPSEHLLRDQRDGAPETTENPPRKNFTIRRLFRRPFLNLQRLLTELYTLLLIQTVPSLATSPSILEDSSNRTQKPYRDFAFSAKRTLTFSLKRLCNSQLLTKRSY